MIYFEDRHANPSRDEVTNFLASRLAQLDGHSVTKYENGEWELTGPTRDEEKKKYIREANRFHFCFTAMLQFYFPPKKLS
jgi:hypothetical protein